MKKWIFIGGATLLAAIAAVAQTSGGGDLIKGHSDALSNAKSVKVNYTFQPIGGASTSYTIQLAKPNLARIEKPNMTIVADGTSIYFFDKKDNSYYKRAETDAELKSLFSTEEMSIWAPFFDKSASSNLTNATPKGTRTIDGVMFKVVEAKVKGKTGENVTLFVHPTDGIARQALFSSFLDNQKSERLMKSKNFELNTANEASLYAWNPPSGSQEVKESDLVSDKWYYDLDEAKADAAKSKRMILLDFFAEW